MHGKLPVPLDLECLRVTELGLRLFTTREELSASFDTPGMLTPLFWLAGAWALRKTGSAIFVAWQMRIKGRRDAGGWKQGRRPSLFLQHQTCD